MSIKCSLLGHRFGETTVEREREEEGTEVVITITELETCTRCGETRVVSENKEVTTLEAPGEGETSGTAGAAGSEAGAGGSGTGAAASGTGGHDAEFVDGDADAAGSDGPDQATIPDAETGSAGDAGDEADDAVIIDAEGEADDDEGDERGAGEWPEETTDAGETGADDAGATAGVGGDGDAGESDDERDHGEWPEEPEGLDPAERAGETAEVEILGNQETADDGDDDAETAPAGGTPDATISGDETGDDRATGAGAVDEGATAGAGSANGTTDAGATDTGTEPGTSGDVVDAASAAVGADEDSAAWPDEAEGAQQTPGGMGDWPEATKRDEPAESGATGPSLGGDEAPSITVPEGMFKCSECGHTTEVESSSLRAGDFCPECHRGTLVQHPDAEDD